MPNLATLLINFERWTSGVRRKSVQVGDHRVAYSEGGKGTDSVLMVHGFTASADNWNRMAARIGKQYRVIAPDLPGWGASTRIDAASYGYPAQVERLHQFVQQIGLRRFHLMGHSMGGGISANYAAKYPGEPITLTLIAPHGVAEPEPSDLAQSVERGDNWLVVTSEAGFERLLDKAFAKRPFIPGTVRKYLAKQVVRGSEKTGKIFDEIRASTPPLEERLGQIKTPTLILWGAQDRLIHVSAAEVFRKGIKDSEVLILHSGHMPLVENARACSEACLAFMGKPGQAAEAAA
jgi:abhydrolase domain-containing protein 6